MSARIDPADVDAAFRAFVDDPVFPCLAGKGVVRADRHARGVYGALGSRRSTRALARDLAEFAATVSDDEPRLRAFVAVFPRSRCDDELTFEAHLWQQLQLLAEHDETAAWGRGVSDDPDDPEFSFSFGGSALFVVGLHPASSRLARRFRWPALVFNPRAQFDRLKETGRFERLRGAVREREIALQGTLNPNLADFGERSEARQYSGRATEPAWRCPFHRAAS
ncbi:MAG: guanitoxin biosynthesis heme-dependent pre-guanitoxin N-hydroxylase GntA [bacterium]